MFKPKFKINQIVTYDTINYRYKVTNIGKIKNILIIKDCSKLCSSEGILFSDKLPVIKYIIDGEPYPIQENKLKLYTGKVE